MVSSSPLDFLVLERDGYFADLFLIGHSLGAGIAALLGIMWTNPETCLKIGRAHV